MSAGSVCLDALMVAVVPLLGTGLVFRGWDGLRGGVPLGLDEPLAADPVGLCMIMVALGLAMLGFDAAAVWRRIKRAVDLEARK